MQSPESTTLIELWQQLRKPLELEVSRGCPDNVISGASIALYARLWAQRMGPHGEEVAKLAQAIAYGLRNYASLPIIERRRRAMAAITLLNSREHPEVPTPAPRTRRSRAKRTQSKADDATVKAVSDNNTLPAGLELLNMPLQEFAPRAKWPAILVTRLRLETVGDLLYHIPREWLTIRPLAEVNDGERVAIVVTVDSREYTRLNNKKNAALLYKYTLIVHDETASAWITSITSEPNRGIVKNSWSPARLNFSPGQRIFVLGQVNRIGKLLDIRMDDIYQLADNAAATFSTGSRVPIYPLTQGVYQSQLQHAIIRALESLGNAEAGNAIIDPLPITIREQYKLLPLLQSLHEMHHPTNDLLYEMARKRLAFEEFLIPQLLLAQRHWETLHDTGLTIADEKESLAELIGKLINFPLTEAQERVLAEIEADLRSPHPMNRLLQGDVGSGKTVIAAAALAFTARAKMQAAMMAPTEILAEQLYLVLSHILQPLGISPVLLTGSVPTAARREALRAIADGTAAIAVGTQALIQDGVIFKNLALAIVDEQHRFGVAQRSALRSKGYGTNALVMTATPIPRTMSLTIYGDLDISILDSLPPGRRPVVTRWISTNNIEEAYRLLREQINEKRQAYVLCPLVEQSELLQSDAAIEMAESLRKRFFDLNIGLLHGRMTPTEKDAAMEAFRSGETHILCCTTVIEVGVDVPNASMMLIHNAEHFGLAQLHQLRGRVGRAEHQSYCILLSHPRFDPAMTTDDFAARQRLRIILNEQDGFAIADADLQLRGPGEYFGTRQSGLLDFKIGNILRDGEALELARDAAQSIIDEDYHLQNPVLAEIRQRVTRLKALLEEP